MLDYFPYLRQQPTTSSPTLAGLPSLKLFGLSVANTTVDSALDWLCARLETGQRTRVAFLNAHCVNIAASDWQYRSALEEADAILPDGSGIALAARMQKRRIAANLNGTDLVPALGRRLAAAGRSVFLLGGRPGVAGAAAAELTRLCPGLRIAGVADGYFQPDAEQGVIDAINASGADVVLVAMGVPMQDTWLERVAPKLDAGLTMGVGGLFDFLSGRIPRAPLALRRTGMEWTYRLYQEPARMWRRYVLGNPIFVARAVATALTPAARRADLACKRALDIVGAACGLVLISPLLLLSILLVRATSPGPALLKQTRVGKDGRHFSLLKFRSMYVDADARRAALLRENQHGADGVTFKLRRDPRVTPVGYYLRRTSIDELPQLWNVLIGDMSLVGPRPQFPHEVARYRPEHHLRLGLRPGLTCLWQISGRADLPFERQMELDLEYLDRRSIWTDLTILARTVPAVLTARGAY